MAGKMIRKSSTLRTINVIGDYWVLSIILLAMNGAERYSDFKSALDVTHATLSQRLKQLVDSQVLRKSGTRQYLLTERGQDLFQIILMILRWELRWSSGGKGKRRTLLIWHAICGCHVDAVLSCRVCHQAIRTEDVSSREGPGAGEEPVGNQRSQRRVKIDSVRNTTFKAAAPIIGDRWAALILASTFKGYHRFDEYLRVLHVSPQILSGRLSSLLSLRLLKKHLYQSAPNRYEYRLTGKGKSFYSVVVAAASWGDRWLDDGGGPPMVLRHDSCRRKLAPEILCGHCHQPVYWGDFTFLLSGSG